MNEQTRKSLKIARIFQTLFLVAIGVYAEIFTALKTYNIDIGFSFSDATLNTIMMVVAIIGIITTFYGYYLPKMLITAYRRGNFRNPATLQRPLNIQITQCMFFEAVAIDGLILGILGADWLIVVPFWVVTAATLIHTFPTEEKWKKMLEKLNPDDYTLLNK